MNKSEYLFKQACDIIRVNDSLSNANEAWEIAHALKILVEANKEEESPQPSSKFSDMSIAPMHSAEQNHK